MFSIWWRRRETRRRAAGETRNTSQLPRESDNVTRVRARARDSEREKGRKSALAREREKEREIERETGLTELVAETGVATADIKDAPCLAHARLSQGS